VLVSPPLRPGSSDSGPLHHFRQDPLLWSRGFRELEWEAKKLQGMG